MVEVVEPAPWSDLDPRVLEVIKTVREVLYFVRSFHNIDFRQLVDKHEMMRDMFTMDSVDGLHDLS